MGTNYEVIYNKCSCCGRADSLHIGKSSAGWKFLFHKHEGKTETVQQWKDLTAKGEIVDEYGKTWAYDDFWALVENKQSETRYTNAGELIDGYNFVDSDFS
jgi:hypothetical protein